MEIYNYIIQKQKIHSTVLRFLENRDNDEDYELLLNLISSQKIKEDKEKLIEFLQLIQKVSKNHHRSHHFIGKIIKIFQNFKDQFKQTFSNCELFNIFQNNKMIILFLFEEEILKLDDYVLNLILNKKQTGMFGFCHFFYPEIKSKIDENQQKIIEYGITRFDPDIFENFNEKRRIGENHLFLCELIRNDSVEEFISYVNRKNISLLSQIKQSIFETNSFLINKEPSLIEYSAFYGSIQIFQYLKLNKVELTPSLWIYAIHGKNADIIHILEENHIEPEDKTYEKCFKEAIKCHHNDIAKYIYEYCVSKNDAYCFKYHNYEFFPDNLNNKFMFFYLCKYNYYNIVILLLKQKSFNINDKIVIDDKI